MNRRSFAGACVGLLAGAWGWGRKRHKRPAILSKEEKIKVLAEIEVLVVKHNATAEDLLAWARLGGRMQDQGINARFAGQVFDLLRRSGHIRRIGAPA